MVRRMTNPKRRDVAASRRASGEARKTLFTLQMADPYAQVCKAMNRRIKWLGAERSEGRAR